MRKDTRKYVKKKKERVEFDLFSMKRIGIETYGN